MQRVNQRRVDEYERSLDEWLPPDVAEPFIHASRNYCDIMDTGNVTLDYDAVITGTAGIAGHGLDQLSLHTFDTYWQADPGITEDNQYFEFVLSEAVNCDACILNFHIPNDYHIPPYTPDPSCWKAWTLKGKLNAGDAWTVLETVTANGIKFYEGTFTRGLYKYFRVESISAYNNTAQDVRIDAYLYNLGIYDSTTKWYDTFPDRLRGKNDINSYPEYTSFEGHYIYITSMDVLMSDLYDMNGSLFKAVKDIVPRQYRHIGGIWSEWHEDVTAIDYPHDAKQTRLNSLDFTVEPDICLYAFPPPNEIWWIISSGYAFDETAANLNTPIILKTADNSHKISPVYTAMRTYSSFAVLGARYTTVFSGEFKPNKRFITFGDPVNMNSMVILDGQAGDGLVTDMNGTVITPTTVAVNAVSNMNVVRLKIGDMRIGHSANLTFNPPIKLDGDNADDVYEIRKDAQTNGSILRFNLRGFKVPKHTSD